MHNNFQINGIQQVGIGVQDAEQAYDWYRKHLNFDLAMFNDKAEARLMKAYTGNKVHSRHAILGLNMQGGGGFEVWQFTSRKAVEPPKNWSDLSPGINAVYIRTKNINKAYLYLKKLTGVSCFEPYNHALAKQSFKFIDPFGNHFQVLEDEYEFINTDKPFGGIMGVCIGVGNLEKSLGFYQDIFNLNEEFYREENERSKRAFVRSAKPVKSAFSELLGPFFLEIVQPKQEQENHLFKNRYWGDLGFIHCCFDVINMADLRSHCQQKGYPFSVDSEGSFPMGKAAGQFAYVEDPDGTLIELVETHRIPLLKSLGWYINLKKRKRKVLPKWMLRLMALGRNPT